MESDIQIAPTQIELAELLLACKTDDRSLTPKAISILRRAMVQLDVQKSIIESLQYQVDSLREIRRNSRERE